MNKQKRPHGVTQRENRLQRRWEALQHGEGGVEELTQVGHQQRTEELSDALRTQLAAAPQLGLERAIGFGEAAGELEQHCILRCGGEEVRLLDEETNETFPEKIHPGDVEADEGVRADEEEGGRGEERWGLLDGGEVGRE